MQPNAGAAGRSPGKSEQAQLRRRSLPEGAGGGPTAAAAEGLSEAEQLDPDWPDASLDARKVIQLLLDAGLSTLSASPQC